MSGSSCVITRLPPELLTEVAELACCLRDVAALARTCRWLHEPLNRILYYLDAKAESPRALLWASAKGVLRIVEQAILAGTNVDVLCDDDYDWLHLPRDHCAFPMLDSTSFLLASGFGHLDVVEYLVKAGANVEWMDCQNQTALFVAAKGGHDSVVEFLLQYTGDKLNLEDSRHNLPLAAAAFQGHFNLCRMLLEQIPSTINEHSLSIVIEAGDYDLFNWLVGKGIQLRSGSFPFNGCGEVLSQLCSKATESRAKICKALLLAGVNLGQAGRNTPLHVACGQRTAAGDDLLRLLLPCMKTVNLRDYWGETPLHWACRSGNATAVKLLLGRDAQCGRRTDNGETPLSIARDKGFYEIVNILLAHANSLSTRQHDNDKTLADHPPPRDAKRRRVESEPPPSPLSAVASDEQQVFLMQGCLSGNVDLVREMLAMGADPNGTYHKMRCSLHFVRYLDDLAKYSPTDPTVPLNWVMFSGNLTIVKLLLDAGADIHKRTWDTSQSSMVTVLHRKRGQLGKANHLAILELLISLGLDPCARAEDGNTPLHDACLSGAADCVRFLLEKGADVAAVREDGITPLHDAAEAASVEALEALVAYGADVHSRTVEGETALHLACSSNEEGRVRAIRYLLSQGADADAKTWNTRSPPSVHLFKPLWHSSVFHTPADTKEALQALIEHRADINAVSINGQTALHLTCLFDCYKATKLLLEHGANANSWLRRWNRPLTFACHGRGGSGCMRLLLAHGADPNAGDTSSNKPLLLAVQSGSVERTRRLLDAGANLRDDMYARGELIAAALNGDCPLLLKLLKRRGLNLHEANHNGHPPLATAARLYYNSFRFLVEEIPPSSSVIWHDLAVPGGNIASYIRAKGLVPLP